MKQILLSLVLLLPGVTAPVIDSNQTWPKATIIERVDSRFPGQSYALYLPGSFDPNKKWPILYCLDARSRGKLPVLQFRDAAEEHGWILAGSNNAASDDPSLPMAQIVNALWSDTHERLPIDEKRVYVTGFSGTARIACEMGMHFKGQIAGVIGCGAGFPYDLPSQIPFAYYGIVGDVDFNYFELKQLRSKLPKVQIPAHHIRIFHGRHEWPPPEVCSEAVEWLQFLAIKDGLTAVAPEVIDKIYSKRIHVADSMRGEGDLFNAVYEYESIVRDFSSLRNVSNIQSRYMELRSSKSFKKSLQEENDRDRQEQVYLTRLESLMRSLHADEGSLPPLGRVLADLQVKKLKDIMSRKDSSQEKLSAQRMLQNAFVQNCFYLPGELLRQKKYRAAVLSLQIAVEIDPENSAVWYSLAKAYALWGEEKKAVESLRTAVRKGFRDLDRLSNEESFKVLFKDKEFLQLLQGLQPR